MAHVHRGGVLGLCCCKGRGLGARPLERRAICHEQPEHERNSIFLSAANRQRDVTAPAMELCLVTLSNRIAFPIAGITPMPRAHVRH